MTPAMGGVFPSHGVKSEVLRFLFVKFATTNCSRQPAAVLVFSLNGIYLLLFTIMASKAHRVDLLSRRELLVITRDL